MTHICLIGNSHLAALKLGWPNVEPQFPETELDFYASAGQSMDLQVKNGKIVAASDAIRHRLAATSGKSGDIEPTYDAYIVCGLTLSLMRAIKAYRAKFVELRATGQHKDATIETYAAAMEPPLRASIAIDVLSKLRRLTKAPVFLVATPLPSYERHIDLWDKLRARRQEEVVALAYQTACRTIASEFDAVFVAQPAETVGEGGLTTRPEFHLLPIEHVRNEKAEHTHMNPTFGAIVLRELLQRVQDRTVSPSR